MDLESYVQAMFPTEKFHFAQLMHKDFRKEVARQLTEAFVKADA